MRFYLPGLFCHGLICLCIPAYLLLYVAPANAEQGGVEPQILSANPGRDAQVDGFLQRRIAEFAASDIEFQRAQSNVPFMPLAFASVSHYGDARVENDSAGIDLTYSVTTASQGAGLPILLGDRDLLIVGETLRHSRFSVNDSPLEDFEVTSVGLPLAWLRQVNPAWQIGGFAMPLGHYSSTDGGNWTWQTLGGGFARWTQNDRLWWAFGLYGDIAPQENTFLPYLGAVWQINERWTVNALMPWPSVLYAPTPDWVMRFGAGPSGASWSVSPAESEVVLNLDAWDLGASLSRRLGNNLWLKVESGVGGLRGLRVVGSEVEQPDTDVGSGWYLKMELNFRPGML